MSYNQKRTLDDFDGTSETDVDARGVMTRSRSQKQPTPYGVPPTARALKQPSGLPTYEDTSRVQNYETLAPNYAPARAYEQPHPAPTTAWSAQQYDLNPMRSPQPAYDELAPPPVPSKPWNSQEYATKRKKYEDLPPKPTYDTLAPNYVPVRAYEQPHPAPSTPWSGQKYDLNSGGCLPQPRYETVSRTPSPRHSPIPWDEAQYTFNPQGRHTPPLSSDDYIQIATTVNDMELFRLRQDGVVSNPLHPQGNDEEVIAVSPLSVPVQPKSLTPTYFQRFKSFVWSTTQRRIATLVITSLVIGGIIGTYFGISNSSTSASTTPSPDTRNCTYPEGVNTTFTQLQETLSAGNSSLSIPGLDPAMCTLISTVVNNTVTALKLGGYNCWQNVQSALMPLVSSALALNMESIQQIITSVQQYCFASSTTPAISSSSTTMSVVHTSTSPANTFTSTTTTPISHTSTIVTSSTSITQSGTTTVMTSLATPSTMTSTITSTTSSTLQVSTTSLVTSSTGTTTTLAPSTSLSISAGSTTITTLEPASMSSVLISSTGSTTLQTSTTSLTPVTTTVSSSTQTTTSISSSAPTVNTTTQPTSTALSTRTTTSPPNTLTTFTTTPTTNAPTTITTTTTTTGAGTTAITTSTPAPTTVTTTITSTSPTTLRATTTSLVTTNTGTTTTLAPSTTTTFPAGTTTITTVAPTTTSTVFVSSSTSTTTTTSTLVPTTTTTTVASTTSASSSVTSTLPCCNLIGCLPSPVVNCTCSSYWPPASHKCSMFGSCALC